MWTKENPRPDYVARKSIEANAYSQAEFISRANIRHNFKYDYSKTRYIKSKTKVLIICPKHGEFKQTPSSHLFASGCPKCAYEENGMMLRGTTDSFIKKAKITHGDLYDYSQVRYVHSNAPVAIKCKKHGVFMQTPHSHLTGKGCWKCVHSIGEAKIHYFLCKNGIKGEEQAKIGAKNINLLRYDFYLPLYNTAIEYQGKQHYDPMVKFKRNTTFIYQLKLDALKKWYCLLHDIKLIVIPYWEKDIEGILTRELQLVCCV